jgi:hypothetical protein
MPKILAERRPSPAAVDAAWVPWPSASRAEHSPVWLLQNSPSSAPMNCM